MNSTAAGQIVKCPNCGSNNRVSTESAAKKAVCGRCRNELPAFSSKPLTVTDANFSQTVVASPLPVLLDLWAAWCAPCRMIAPTIEALAAELAGRVTVGKLDVDANPQTASRFNVQGIPTLLILQNGREVERIVGVESKESILRRLQRFM